MKLKLRDSIDIGLLGDFNMEVVDAITKEVISTHQEKNIIVLDAKKAIIRAVGDPVASSTITSIKLGEDIGTGTVDIPQEPANTYDETTMTVVFAAPYPLIVGQLDPQSITFNVTIVGADVMAEYPMDESKRLNSAALHVGNGEVFAYKRFPQKSISALVDVNITWTLSIS